MTVFSTCLNFEVQGALGLNIFKIEALFDSYLPQFAFMTSNQWIPGIRSDLHAECWLEPVELNLLQFFGNTKILVPEA